MQTIDQELSRPLPDYVRNAKRYADDPLATARALRPVFEAGAAENERLGRLCDDTVRALCESGLFGMLLPRELGGIETPPSTYIAVIEELSYADGSTGWVTMASGFTIMGASAWCGPEAVKAMFDGTDGFLSAGQIAPNGIAERVDGGYRISGQFHFGSGTQISSWFLGAFALREAGEPVLDESGLPVMLWGFAPRDKVFIDESTWDVAGLSGTASHDFKILDQVVHEDFIIVPPGNRIRGGPALDIGVSMGHVSFSLGAGTRILDEIAALAQRKRRVGRLTLIDQPAFQRDYGLMRASMEAARAAVRSVYDEWYDEAQTNGTASLAIRAKARLTASWATKLSTEVAQWAYIASGSDGLRNGEDNVIQRVFRDIEASAVHRHVEDNVVIDASTVLLGVHPPTLQL